MWGELEGARGEMDGAWVKMDRVRSVVVTVPAIERWLRTILGGPPPVVDGLPPMVGTLPAGERGLPPVEQSLVLEPVG